MNLPTIATFQMTFFYKHILGELGSSIRAKISRDIGAVYMSPVCRDETLAGLKIEKRNLGENMLTRIG